MSEIVKLKLSDIHPYEQNPRKITQKAVDDCAESIRQCGYKAKIIVDENNVIIAGHTRLQALQKLGWKVCEVQRETDMTEEQKKKYRLLDNKTSENGQWDFEMLDWELEELDFEGYDFGFDLPDINFEEHEQKEAKYSESVSVVIECEDDEEAERIFNQLQEEGFKCRISTL